MLRTIYLHGSLKALHDGPIKVFAETIAEAIKIATTQIKGFEPNAITGRKCIQIVGVHSEFDLYEKNNQEEIHVLPFFGGGKKGGLIKILIGAVLIAASFIPGVAPLIGSFLFSVGISMILSGVLQVLTPAPKRDTTPNAADQKNNYLGAPKNTVEIGTRIPILYGRRKIGGHLLSVNISAVQTGI